VAHDLDSLKSKLHELLPGEDIKVYTAQRSLVLAGRVSSVTSMNAALAMANGYLAQVATNVKAQQFEQESGSKRDDKAVGQVINLMEVAGSQQVMLSVKVAEIDRTELRRLDARFNAIFKGSERWSLGGVNGGATFPDVVFNPPINGRLPSITNGTLTPQAPAVTEFAPTTPFIDDKGIFASFLTDDFLFNLTLDAAKDKGLAKILAEPTLTTLSGQEAKFLSGGEFPIPVPQGEDGIAIEFKEFGVALNFLPMVLSSNHINLRTNVTVSELIDTNEVLIRSDGVQDTFFVPSLRKRSANTVVELKDGQTIGIAGLINENLREAVRKFPLLGDMPVIGPLFRSQEFLKGETELVILVTPRLAKPLAPDQIRLPTDSFIEPTEREFFLYGRMEGQARRETPSEGQVAGGTEGSYGPTVQ
jgi:pilus assembly protein CpaC